MPEDPVLTRPNPVPSTTDVRRLGTAKLDALKPSKGPPTESEDDSGGSAPESTPEILRRSPTATPAAPAAGGSGWRVHLPPGGGLQVDVQFLSGLGGPGYSAGHSGCMRSQFLRDTGAFSEY